MFPIRHMQPDLNIPEAMLLGVLRQSKATYADLVSFFTPPDIHAWMFICKPIRIGGLSTNQEIDREGACQRISLCKRLAPRGWLAKRPVISLRPVRHTRPWFSYL